MSSKKPTFKFESAAELLAELASTAYFDSGDGSPMLDMHVGATGSRVVVVAGENASGKSFVRRLVSGMSKIAGHEVMPLSLEGRFDYSGGLGALRSMVYGDEEQQATGVNSAKLLKTGVRNCMARTNTHVVVWDEPELGLSEGAQMGAGAFLAEKLPELTPATVAAVLITHSKPLARKLVPLAPNFVWLGPEPLSLTDWLDRAEKERSLDDVEEDGHRRWKLINQFLRENAR